MVSKTRRARAKLLAQKAAGVPAAGPAGEAVPPTPETAAKLRRDVVQMLEDQGRLRPEHVRAAHEVRRVWEAFGRGLFTRAQSIAPVAERRKRAMFADPVGRLSLAEERAWRLRYRPWAREMAITVAAGTIRTSRLQLVLDIVVDNNGTRQVEGWYRMRHGAALEHVRAALHRYAELARRVAAAGGLRPACGGRCPTDFAPRRAADRARRERGGLDDAALWRAARRQLDDRAHPARRARLPARSRHRNRSGGAEKRGAGGVSAAGAASCREGTRAGLVVYPCRAAGRAATAGEGG